MNVKLAATIASGSVLAGAAGFGAAVTIAQAQTEPQVTTTVNVGTGEQGEPGPPGPIGPQGPAGEVDCGVGFVWGILVINHPGGQVTTKTCIQNP